MRESSSPVSFQPQPSPVPFQPRLSLARENRSPAPFQEQSPERFQLRSSPARESSSPVSFQPPSSLGRETMPRRKSPIPYRHHPLGYTPHKLCLCNQPAGIFISWSQYPGRRYLNCMLPQSAKCKFF
ncbi:uncharacterized protein LOC123445703 [Hordeum vulgare subsp. vulgare]|uniref:uncharacterized protein LOC123445703 n=1 Tax=Hordeum vulgare subsp. vulgare TaxID=112509 RepID=UPI001D1A50DC|nr:uncharacterized protein LOC123445703 [Hordeum vulgare subsp. vulgare]